MPTFWFCLTPLAHTLSYSHSHFSLPSPILLPLIFTLLSQKTEQRFKTNFTNSLEQDWEDMKKRTLESLGHPHLFAASTKDFNPRKIIEYSVVISRRQEPLLPQFMHVSRTIEFVRIPSLLIFSIFTSLTFTSYAYPFSEKCSS
jgi:hypothetical protein